MAREALIAISPSAWWRATRVIAADIKIAHSVFAMPFAVLGATAAGVGLSGQVELRRFVGQITLIVLAMVLARTAAMLANRLIDCRIDAANPRTSGRALPSGRLSAREALFAILTCGAAFLAVCAGFGIFFGNWWPLALGLPVLVWICSYGWLKRFSSLCHLYLGSSLAISPVAAALAVNPEELSRPTVWLLAAMVMCWVAGFDVIYALQDVDVDRRDGLHSLPSRAGVPVAMMVSRILHAWAAVFLFLVWRLDTRFGPEFMIAILVVWTLLAFEHLTVARWGTSRIALTFFTLNGLISCLVGILGCIDLL